MKLDVEKLEAELSEIRRRTAEIRRREISETRLRFYREAFPIVETLESGFDEKLDGGFSVGHIAVNGYRVEKIISDNYNNLRCHFPRVIPAEIWEPLATLFFQTFESGTGVYPYRRIQTLFMNYWLQMFMQIDHNDLAFLLRLARSFPCERNAFSRNGFPCYMLSDRYSQQGVNGWQFREWPYRMQFVGLRAAENLDSLLS